MTSDVEMDAPRHCGQPMKDKGSRHGWEDDDELSTWRYACEVCGATATLSTRIPVGPPVASAS